MTATTHVNPPATTRYHVTGMDCARCAVELKDVVPKVAGVLSVDVSIAAQILTVSVDDAGARLPEIEDAVSALGYPLRRLYGGGEDGSVNSDDDELPKDLSQIASAYRRALWIVVLINIGYGSVEIVAGFIAGSQALKADALDFFGDGVITLLGLLAIRWSLGLSVIGTTIYRIFVVYRPEAELMGIFGAIALIVNVAAALVLIPHRTGDANARAVWLFSRNDAIGNVAVVIAAGLVAWTATPWPDLVVAFAIAALFLQSSWSIIGDALRELRPTTYGEGVRLANCVLDNSFA